MAELSRLEVIRLLAVIPHGEEVRWGCGSQVWTSAAWTYTG